MIAKILKRGNIRSVIRYNTNKIGEGKAEMLSTGNIHLAARNQKYQTAKVIQRVMTLYARPAEMNSNINDYVFHAVISPKENDIPNDKLSEIAREFMDRIGYGGQPYFAVKHEDTDNTHIHIVSIDTDGRGRRCVDDGNLYRRANEARKDIEKKYGLEKAEQGLGRAERHKQAVENANRLIAETRFDNDVEKVVRGKDYTRNIKRVLYKVRGTYDVSDYDKLNKALAVYNIRAEVVERYNGIVFYSIDKDGRRTGKAIAGSAVSMPKSVWDRTIARNARRAEERQRAASVMKKIAMRECGYILKRYDGKITTGDFQRLMRERGVSVQFYPKRDGPGIFGATFVDNVNGLILKASEVDRTLPAMLAERIEIGGEGESYGVRQVEKAQRAFNRLLKEEFAKYRGRRSRAILNLEFPQYEQRFVDAMMKDSGVPRETVERIYLELRREQTGMCVRYEREEREDFEKKVGGFIRAARHLGDRDTMELMQRLGLLYKDDKFIDADEPSLTSDADPGKFMLTMNASFPEKRMMQYQTDFFKMLGDTEIEKMKFNWCDARDDIFKYLSREDATRARRKMASDMFTEVMNGISGEKSVTEFDIVLRLLKHNLYIRNENGKYYLEMVASGERLKLVVSDKRATDLLDSLDYGGSQDVLIGHLLGDMGYGTAKSRCLQRIMRTADYEKEVLARYSDGEASEWVKERIGERWNDAFDYVAGYSPEIGTHIRRMRSLGYSASDITNELLKAGGKMQGFVTPPQELARKQEEAKEKNAERKTDVSKGTTKAKTTTRQKDKGLDV